MVIPEQEESTLKRSLIRIVGRLIIIGNVRSKKFTAELMGSQ